MAVGAVLGACGPESKAHDGGDSTGGVAGSTASGGSGAAGGAGSGGTAAGGDDGACNQVETNAKTYPFVSDSGPAPEARGGTILDGTYFATSETQYESPPSPTFYRRGARIEIAGSSWQEADPPEPEDTLGTIRRYTYAVSVESPRLTMTETCPSAGEPQVFSYTVEQTGLIVYLPTGDVTLGITLTRQ
jgi:hypothetical protein